MKKATPEASGMAFKNTVLSDGNLGNSPVKSHPDCKRAIEEKLSNHPNFEKLIEIVFKGVQT
jgi:hypothetical protein